MKAAIGKKIGTGVLIIMMAACCLPATAGAFGPGEGGPGKGFDRPGHGRLAFGLWRNPRAIEKLKLTEAQVKQLRDLDFTTREKMLPLKTQIEAVHLKIDKAMSDDNIDRELVLTLAQKTADLKGKIFVRKIEARLAFKEILTADQLNELKLLFGPRKMRGPQDKMLTPRPDFQPERRDLKSNSSF